jgi:chromosome partitioning protein
MLNSKGETMKTITLANMKGGTGKTSLSVSLAAELAKTDKTAILDFDPQANTTAWTAPEPWGGDSEPEIADVLQAKTTAQAAIIPTETERLFLLPTYANGDLKDYVENSGELAINKAVKTLIADIAKMNFAFCIVDLSPAFGKLERAALISADETITPILADRFSLDGLETIAANLTDLQNLVDKPIAQYRRLIVNGLDGRIKRHAATLENLKKNATQIIYTVPIDQVFFRAQRESKPIQKMDAKPETLNEIARLANDIREGK